MIKSIKRMLEGGAKDVFRRKVLGGHCGHIELSEPVENHDLVQRQGHIVLNVSRVQDDVS